MIRYVLVAMIAVSGLALAPAAPAQTMSARSYAPENLKQLSVADRIRVLETEYREISRGRTLPRDQRDFYLAQINSGWTFSRIKTDMAQSLGGNQGGNPGGWDGRDDDDRYDDDRYDDDDRYNNGNGNGWNGANSRPVLCESIRQRYVECRVSFNGRARISRKLSNAECVEGRSWGQRQGLIWVSRGCRAEFTHMGGGNWGGGPGNPQNGYNVTCSSVDNRYMTCAWNQRQGRPYLIEKLSRNACVEGQSWGYRDNQLWVDRGCRARFGVRNR